MLILNILLTIIFVLPPKFSHLQNIFNHLGISYIEENNEFDKKLDKNVEIEETLLDQDIEEMMSNNMNNEYDRGCPGLDYLGVGYDSIFANSLGSDMSFLDPGYRAPIIEFTWRKNSEGYSPTLGSLHPVGGWVRPVFSCIRSTKINEINDSDEFKDSISASSKLNGDIPDNSFTGSLEYKNSLLNFKSKRQKIYNKIEQCIRYQVGIPLNLEWNYTKTFKFVVSKLTVLDFTELKKCNITDKLSFSSEECSSIKPWIKFFDMFGTHFNNQLTLGGKITQSMTFDVESLEKMRKKGIDIDAEIRTELGSGAANLKVDMKKKKSKLDEIGHKKMSVLGGKMPNFPIDDKEFAEWAQTVAENPMPIGVVATSIKVLLDPILHSSYDYALQQYAIVNGINYEQLKMISGDSNDLSNELENGYTIFSWNKNNRIECPSGSKVLMGFSLIFGDHGLLSINQCNSKSKKCLIPTYENVKYSLNLIICTIGLQPSVDQMINASEKHDKHIKLECANNKIVQMGLVVVTRGGIIISMKECKYGLKSCKFDLNDDEMAYMWILCYFHDNTNKTELKFSYNNPQLSCTDGYKMITGFIGYFPDEQTSEFKDPEPCEKYSTACSFKSKEPNIMFILCKSSLD